MNRREEEYPKVLVASPFNDRNIYNVKKWLECITSFDYPHYNIYLIYVGFHEGVSYRYVKEKYPDIKLRFCQQLRNRHIYDAIAGVKNAIIQEILCFDYDYWIKIDPDTLLPKNTISRFVGYDKDMVSALSFLGYLHETFPWVLKSGRNIANKNFPYDNYTREEIDEYRNNHRDRLMSCYFAGMGQTMIRRNVLEEIHFRNILYDFALDIQFAWQFNLNGFEGFVDLGIEAEHNPVPWDK